MSRASWVYSKWLVRNSFPLPDERVVGRIQELLFASFTLSFIKRLLEVSALLWL